MNCSTGNNWLTFWYARARIRARLSGGMRARPQQAPVGQVGERRAADDVAEIEAPRDEAA